MARIARRPGTYEDLLALPEHLVGELINGELIVSPRPAMRHLLAVDGLGDDLRGPFGRDPSGPGGWWIVSEAELHLGRDVLVPDLAGWRRERMPLPPDAPFVEIAPDWVCEVLSPSTEAVDRKLKLPKFGAAGIPHAWLVNPIARTLEAYERQADRWSLVATFSNDDRARIVPFDAIELDLARLWLPEDE